VRDDFHYHLFIELWKLLDYFVENLG
jgi:hypothetical protein